MTLQYGRGVGRAGGAGSGAADLWDGTIERAEVRIQPLTVIFGATEDTVDVSIRPVISTTRAFVRTTLTNNPHYAHPSTVSGTFRTERDMEVSVRLIDDRTVRFTRPSVAANIDVTVTAEVWEYKGPAGGPNEFETVLLDSQITVGSANTSGQINVPGALQTDKLIPFLNGCLSASGGYDNNMGRLFLSNQPMNMVDVGVQRTDIGTTPTFDVTVVNFKGSAWEIDSEFDASNGDGPTFRGWNNANMVGAIPQPIGFATKRLGAGQIDVADQGIIMKIPSVIAGVLGWDWDEDNGANSPFSTRQFYFLQNNNTQANTNNATLTGTAQAFGTGLSIPSTPAAPEDGALNRVTMSANTNAQGTSFVFYPRQNWSVRSLFIFGVIGSWHFRGRGGGSSVVTAGAMIMPTFVDEDTVSERGIGQGCGFGQGEGTLIPAAFLCGKIEAGALLGGAVDAKALLGGALEAAPVLGGSIDAEPLLGGDVEAEPLLGGTIEIENCDDDC